MKILSSFTHPQVVPNLYECLCSAEHKGRYSEECGKQSSSGAPLTSIVFFFPTMEVNGAPKQPGSKLSSKYLPLCSAEQRNSYRFGTTWGGVNDDRIFIFGWTIPLILCVVTWMIYCFLFCDGCSWVPCLFWTVKLNTVLQKNPSCPAESSVFHHLLHIWTLSSSDYMILRNIFSHWGQLRDLNTTIKKGSNINWRSRRKHDVLRAGGWKLLNRMKMSKFFLFCWNIFLFFHLVLPFWSNRR